ncbi:hypothetical protein BZL41_13255 [Pseudomonas sp. PIC25]|uniref:DUF7673 family protein n=1 Tax=Pseudomonas sp. PIC25 TaxID=1958773 RepID=UPI000BAB368C|nr:hypothetical protein [Pseudomonas sp. PIC25]PAU62547.1 hypothetical protein BZL41_13255 [Pseudomonas sp. PIC25]
MGRSISATLAKALAYQLQRPAIVIAGEQALHRLIPVALRDSGQSRVIGRLLLNLYDGSAYPFDLTELRLLDLELFEDSLRVLMLDYSPEVNVHERVPNGTAIWQRLIALWAPAAVTK